MVRRVPSFGGTCLAWARIISAVNGLAYSRANKNSTSHQKNCDLAFLPLPPSTSPLSPKASQRGSLHVGHSSASACKPSKNTHPFTHKSTLFQGASKALNLFHAAWKLDGNLSKSSPKCDEIMDKSLSKASREHPASVLHSSVSTSSLNGFTIVRGFVASVPCPCPPSTHPLVIS